MDEAAVALEGLESRSSRERGDAAHTLARLLETSYDEQVHLSSRTLEPSSSPTAAPVGAARDGLGPTSEYLILVPAPPSPPCMRAHPRVQATVLGAFVREGMGLELLLELLADPEPAVYQRVLVILGNLCSGEVDPQALAAALVRP